MKAYSGVALSPLKGCLLTLWHVGRFGIVQTMRPWDRAHAEATYDSVGKDLGGPRREFSGQFLKQVWVFLLFAFGLILGSRPSAQIVQPVSPPTRIIQQPLPDGPASAGDSGSAQIVQPLSPSARIIQPLPADSTSAGDSSSALVDCRIDPRGPCKLPPYMPAGRENGGQPVSPPPARIIQQPVPDGSASAGDSSSALVPCSVDPRGPCLLPPYKPERWEYGGQPSPPHAP